MNRGSGLEKKVLLEPSSVECSKMRINDFYKTIHFERKTVREAYVQAFSVATY